MPYCITSYSLQHIEFALEKKLLGMQTIKEGAVVFDPNVEKHHHFIDNETGDIYDIPWEQLHKEKEKLKDFEVAEFQVILRGRRKKK